MESVVESDVDENSEELLDEEGREVMCREGRETVGACDEHRKDPSSQLLAEPEQPIKI